MAYFANSEQANDYEWLYCDHCVHQDLHGRVCAVWAAQLLHNEAQKDNADSVLQLLIPRFDDGINNDECRLFLERKKLKGQPR